MKIKKGFVLRDVAGRSVVVATGAAAQKFRGMVMLNDTGREGCGRCSEINRTDAGKWIFRRINTIQYKEEKKEIT